MRKSYSFSNRPKENYSSTEQQLMDKIAVVVLNSFNDISVFSMKGGWVLSKLFPNGFRKTVDVDMSISDVKYFDNLINNLEELCVNLMNTGDIHNYKIIYPNVETHRSGGVKMYRLAPNGRKYKVSGLDVSVKSLDSCVVVMNDFLPVFCFERMLADKISVLFSDSYLRRIKDIFDARLIIEKCELDNEKLLKFLYDNNVVFDLNQSVFSEDLDLLKNEWNAFLNNSNPKNYTDLSDNLTKIKDYLIKIGVITK